MKPYPRQQELIDFLGNPMLKSRLIADEMGVGKTIEALGCDLRFRAHNKGYRQTLIVAPLSTHDDVWRRTVWEYLGKRAVVIDPKSRGRFIQAILNGQGEYFVVHYEAMRLIIKALQDVRFLHVICDETHRLKNPSAQQTKAVKKLKTIYKTSMSGTPADDKPWDLWSTLNFLYPGHFSSLRRFIDAYCEVEEGTGVGGVKYRKPIGVKIDHRTGKPDAEAMQDLQRQLSAFYMRRRKKDVLADLPEKYYTKVTVDLLPAQRRIYDELESEMLAWIGQHQNEPLPVATALSKIVRMQQAALGYLEWGEGGKWGQKVRIIEPSAKLNRLVEMYQDESIRPFVVFSNSKSMTYLAKARLEREGLRVADYTGDTPRELRIRHQRGFQDGDFDVFAATIKAGGEGIDLFAASTVFFMDRWWNPSVNLQAEDRLHREGQKNAVQVVDFQARNSVDLRVEGANVHKWAGIQAILGDDRS